MRATRHIDSSPRGARAVALAAAAGIMVHLVLRSSDANLRYRADVPLYAALVAGGLPSVVQLVEKLWAWEFGSGFWFAAPVHR